MKISQVRSNLQIIFINLQQLQACRDNLTSDNLASEAEKIAKCKEKLEEAFACLESESLEKVVTQIRKRKKERMRRLKRLKMIKKRETSSNNCHNELPSSSCSHQQSLTALNKKELRDANKYLAFMDSLETLHRLQGGGDSCKLKESLNSIRNIWQSTAENIKRQAQNSSSIENQWNQVLFGGNAEPEMKYGLRELIERRSIWDSYLVPEDDPTGSHIPIGWVCPRVDARPEWKQFKL